MKDHFDAIQSSGYSVSLVHRLAEAADQRSLDQEPGRAGIGISRDSANFSAQSWRPEICIPIAELSAENCTEQMGVPGPWYERLPHFRMGFTPSAGKELQSEYFVPRRNAVDAILAVERLREQVSPHLLITEIRTIAADDLWMSPVTGGPASRSISPGSRTGPRCGSCCRSLKGNSAPFEPRPHWGKLFTTSPPNYPNPVHKDARFCRTRNEVRSARENFATIS